MPQLSLRRDARRLHAGQRCGARARRNRPARSAANPSRSTHWRAAEPKAVPGRTSECRGLQARAAAGRAATGFGPGGALRRFASRSRSCRGLMRAWPTPAGAWILHRALLSAKATRKPLDMVFQSCEGNSATSSNLDRLDLTAAQQFVQCSLAQPLATPQLLRRGATLVSVRRLSSAWWWCVQANPPPQQRAQCRRS